MAGDEEIRLVLDEAGESMEKTIDRYKRELVKVRTGRANPAQLDGLMVEYFDTPTPLKQLASLSVPDPRMIVISPFDKTVITNIEKAIQTSDMGVTPTNDGKVVRIAIPPLTEERRKQLVRQVKKTAEEYRVSIRDARRDALSILKDLESDGTLPKDDRHRAEKSVQDLTDEFVRKVDELTSAKETEVLEV